MQKSIPLDRLTPGQRATVVSIRPSPFADRLTDLGLTPGSAVSCVMRAGLGDPQAYRIRDGVFALRSKDAAAVDVRPIAPGEAAE